MATPKTAFVGCGFLAATLVVISAVQQGLPDADDYRVYAEKYAVALFDGGPSPDAYRPPFYPSVLAPIVRFVPSPNVWITLLHVGLTIATLASRTTRHDTLDRRPFLSARRCRSDSRFPIGADHDGNDLHGDRRLDASSLAS